MEETIEIQDQGIKEMSMIRDELLGQLGQVKEERDEDGAAEQVHTTEKTSDQKQVQTNTVITSANDTKQYNDKYFVYLKGIYENISQKQSEKAPEDQNNLTFVQNSSRQSRRRKQSFLPQIEKTSNG